MRVATICFMCMIYTKSIYAEESYQYISLSQGKKSETTWLVDKSQENLLVSSTSTTGEMGRIELSTDYTLNRIEQNNPTKGHKFQAYRDNELLITSCELKQKSKTKTHKIGQRPWVQEFVFAFKDFLASTDREYKFEIIHPEDLDMHDMIAIKQYEEALTIDGTSYTALKMKITLQGFKGRFWKAEAWYDTKTHRMLRYRANEGPGTPITDTLFIGAKDKAV